MQTNELLPPHPDSLQELRIEEARKDGYLRGLDDATKALRAKEMHDAADEVQKLKSDGGV